MLISSVPAERMLLLYADEAFHNLQLALSAWVVSRREPHRPPALVCVYRFPSDAVDRKLATSRNLCIVCKPPWSAGNRGSHGAVG